MHQFFFANFFLDTVKKTARWQQAADKSLDEIWLLTAKHDLRDAPLLGKDDPIYFKIVDGSWAHGTFRVFMDDPDETQPVTERVVMVMIEQKTHTHRVSHIIREPYHLFQGVLAQVSLAASDGLFEVGTPDWFLCTIVGYTQNRQLVVDGVANTDRLPQHRPVTTIPRKRMPTQVKHTTSILSRCGPSGSPRKHPSTRAGTTSMSPSGTTTRTISSGVKAS